MTWEPLSDVELEWHRLDKVAAWEQNQRTWTAVGAAAILSVGVIVGWAELAVEGSRPAHCAAGAVRPGETMKDAVGRLASQAAGVEGSQPLGINSISTQLSNAYADISPGHTNNPTSATIRLCLDGYRISPSQTSILPPKTSN